MYFNSRDPNCNDSDSDDDDYIEEPYIDTSLEGFCLFCDKKEFDCDNLLSHMKDFHSIDLKELCKTNQLDSILYIKLINFIRSKKLESSQVNHILSETNWQDDCFMKPVIQNDLLLTLDVEDSDDDDKPTKQTNKCTTSQEGDEILQQRASLLLQEINKARSLIDDLTISENSQSTNQNFISSDNYFCSYSHHSIHHEMLSDKVRTEAYRVAIDANSDKFKGKSVLDIGCGTGILSFFSHSAGASKVVAVDKSEIIYSAIDIAHENGLADAIEFKKGALEELELETKFDIIVSEWMGYFLLFEGMLDTIITARDKYLKPDGLIFPGSCSLFLAAISDDKLYQERISFWDNVYGYKMTSLKKDVLNEVLVREIESSSIISDPGLIKTFDIKMCTIEEAQNIEAEFKLNICKDILVHGLAVWFDCYFDGSPRITLSTSPNSETTHWKQSILFFKEPVQAKAGSTLNGKIVITRIRDDLRSLQIKLTLDGKETQRFIMM